MSKEFKIANWKVEVDWSGMSLAPVEISTASGGERRSSGGGECRSGSGSIAETTLATACGTDTTQPKHKNGEQEVWV